MDLTPEVAAPAPPRRRRRPVAYAVLLVVLVALGVVVYKGLSSASMYFYNANEAVDRKADLGTKRFRLQGTVLRRGYHETADGVDFEVAFGGESVDVHHDGDPPQLFKIGLPVVLEGHWDPNGRWYDSDTILVKHSATYTADHEDRLKEATTSTVQAPK
jgi:cytochrome c-type biogenesis protein CcmE